MAARVQNEMLSGSVVFLWLSIPYAIPEDDMKTAEGDGLTCRLRGRYRAQVRANFIFRRYYSAILMPSPKTTTRTGDWCPEFTARNKIQAYSGGLHAVGVSCLL